MRDTLLGALVSPASIALVGASNSEGKLTARPMRFLRRHGYAGRIYPVNPARETVLGEKAWPSVSAIPGKVDFAYILVDADPAIEALKDCAAASVKVAAILADGFAEAGEEGERRQAEVQRIAREAGLLRGGGDRPRPARRNLPEWQRHRHPAQPGGGTGHRLLDFCLGRQRSGIGHW